MRRTKVAGLRRNIAVALNNLEQRRRGSWLGVWDSPSWLVARSRGSWLVARGSAETLSRSFAGFPALRNRFRPG